MPFEINMSKLKAKYKNMICGTSTTVVVCITTKTLLNVIITL